MYHQNDIVRDLTLNVMQVLEQKPSANLSHRLRAHTLLKAVKQTNLLPSWPAKDSA